MPQFHAITDDDLARAREDAAFRQRLLAENLGLLIDELQRSHHRDDRHDPADPAQLREGAELAVKLADMISRLGPLPATPDGTEASPASSAAAKLPARRPGG